MPKWLEDVLAGLLGVKYAADYSVWNWCMGIVFSLFGLSPSEYSSGAYQYVSGTVYPLFLAFGTILLNLFLFTGVIRQSANLKENITTEMWVELFIKATIANFVMVRGLTMMNDFISMSTDVTGLLIDESSRDAIVIANMDADFGSIAQAYSLFALIPQIGSIICGFSIVITVLQRFLNLYLTMAVAPIALSTWAGGRGFEETAYAWIKSFLASCFQIVLIAITLKVASFMCVQMNGMSADGLKSLFDGYEKSFIAVLIMFFLKTAVSNSYSWLQSTFNLR